MEFGGFERIIIKIRTYCKQQRFITACAANKGYHSRVLRSQSPEYIHHRCRATPQFRTGVLGHLQKLTSDLYSLLVYSNVVVLFR